MPKLRVHAFSISLDGYGAGPSQDLANPLGVGGMELHKWAFATRTIQRVVFGKEAGTTGVDDDFAARGLQNIGAYILGRNMFGPVRGPWPDDSWKGWWGDNPPYHCPVFVLTNHPRSSIAMDGGTTFHFVTDGIHAALERARDAAQGKDIRLGGGVATIRQYLTAELIDELPDEHRETGGGSAHLQGCARYGADDDAADDAGDDTGGRRHARRQRDAHAKGQRDEEDDNGCEEVAAEGFLGEGRSHVASCRAFFALVGHCLAPAARA